MCYIDFAFFDFNELSNILEILLMANTRTAYVRPFADSYTKVQLLQPTSSGEINTRELL